MVMRFLKKEIDNVQQNRECNEPAPASTGSALWALIVARLNDPEQLEWS